jgi:hypothetical protein
MILKKILDHEKGYSLPAGRINKSSMLNEDHDFVSTNPPSFPESPKNKKSPSRLREGTEYFKNS